ncbi:DUF2848 domain-containing protein [Rhodopseudomonas palustris]|uniref:DUF2848 domain-containing protein n=1 Tax=Rhodopseudomonas palustris TaxID=1076 RepID=A0A323UBP3_RHOPL|nr:DUF2848 domain-containing protein [Rhodopseudomonas palustris]PZA10245.1 DUF2848 domain-containing protein [Rhodopseudomonas palustris]
MYAAPVEFVVHEQGRKVPHSIQIGDLIIAGWTGRDPVARDKHIKELEELGIAPPASTPIYYRVAASRLTTRTAIECSDENSSGEVEFVLIKSGGKLYVGVGSDHTDRKVETYNITVSKQICDKPVAPELWAVDEVAAHWDQLVLRSFATIGGERVLYQEGTLSGMLPPAELIEREFGQACLPEGAALFGGTFAAKGGIRPATRFEYELSDPVLNRSISSGYDVRTLPVLG